MSEEPTLKLVAMANQIAQAFEAQRGQPVRDTVAHIRSFWSPAMRDALVGRLLAGVDHGLCPIAHAAIADLASSARAGT